MLFLAVDRDLVAAAGDVVDHRLVEIELLAQLVEIGDLQPRAELDLALVGLQLPSSRLSRVDLPQPFGPMMPIRSPRRMVVEKPRMIGLSSQA